MLSARFGAKATACADDRCQGRGSYSPACAAGCTEGRLLGSHTLGGALLRSLLPSALFLCSCFTEPTFPIIRCDEANPCATGTCENSQCVDTRDSAVDAPTDAGVDGSTKNGCAGVGIQLGGAFCCPGSFSAGQARAKCRTGFVPCQSAAVVDLAACAKLTGFCIAEVQAHDFGGGGPVMCGADPGTANRDWAGCGNKASYTQAATCGGFANVLRCQPGSGWDCFAGHTLDKTANSSTADGILCCPQ